MWAYIGNKGGHIFWTIHKVYHTCTSSIQSYLTTWCSTYVITTLIINDDDDDTNEASRKNVILQNDDVYEFKGIAVIQSIKEYYYE